jgi:hypothetical protein
MRAFGLLLLPLLIIAGTSRADQILVRKSDGTAISVQTTGPLAEGRAATLARDINQYDAASKGDDVFAAVDDAALRQALNALAKSLRDDAADQLDLAYRVASRTSAGVDDRLLAPGFDSMRKLSERISRPPTRQYVRTQITTSIAGTVLWFMGHADFKNGSDAWVGYTLGLPMKIGAYEFRLTGPGSARPRCQRVVVMSDPMIATLAPIDCP